MAFVASGTKAGVRTGPWFVRSMPARAREPGSRAWISSTGTGADGTRQVRADLGDHAGRVVAHPPVGEPQDEVARELEVVVAPAVGFERRGGVVHDPAVHLGHDALPGPEEVHEVPGDHDVRLGGREARPLEEVEDVMLERAARVRAAHGHRPQRRPQGAGPAAARLVLQEVLDRADVEPEDLRRSMPRPRSWRRAATPR